MLKAKRLRKPTKPIDRVIIGIAVAGLVTLLISIWVAFNVEAETSVGRDGAGALIVEGPEAELVGKMNFENDLVTLEIRGLPDAATIAEHPEARYAICAARDDPNTVWEEPSATLRVLLHSEDFDDLCSVYPSL